MIKKDNEKLMELKHDPVPGYKKTFYIVFTIGILYLVAVFLFGPH